MRGLFTKQSLALEAGQAVSGIAGHAQTLRVLRGRVWITVEGVSHDYWLSAGDSLAAIPGRLIVVEADRADSRLDIMTTRKPSMLMQLGKQARAFAQRVASGKNSQAGLQQCTLAHCQRQL